MTLDTAERFETLRHAYLRGQSAQAGSLARQLLAEPELPAALLVQLTELTRRLGDLPAAANAGERAVAAAPELASAHNNLGLVRLDQGREAEAARHFETALGLDPSSVRARHNLARLWIEQGRLHAAEALLHEALRMEATPIGWTGLGAIARRRREFATALACWERALALDPQHLRAWLNQAAVWREQGALDQAERQLRALSAKHPQSAEAWMALGEHYDAASSRVADQGAHAEAALDAYERARWLRPHDAALRCVWLDVRRKRCDWRDDWPEQMAWLHRRLAEEAESGRASALPPLTSLRFPTTPAEQLAIARAQAQRIAAEVADLPRPRWSVAHGDHRLRIGLLGHEFRANVVGHFLRHLPGAFDRERFVIEAFPYNPDDGSAIRRDLLAGCDHWEDLTGLTPAPAAARIAARGIQVLLDINPYMDGGRPEIAALRPAPIQLSYLYPGTSGAPWMDGIVIDEVVAPAEQAPFYSEQRCLLPPCYLPATGRVPLVANVPGRAHYGLPAGAFVFCSFNRADKLDPETFAAWLRILAAAPQAVLWLTAEGAVLVRLRARAETQGIDPARLIAVTPEPDMGVHLARHAHADLFLDSFIHGAHVTAADALWAGLPVLTRRGATYAGRVASSLLQAAGLAELIAEDTQDYVSRALDYARHPARLKHLRADWAARRAEHPLFCAATLAQHLGAVFERLWRDGARLSADENPSGAPHA